MKKENPWECDVLNKWSTFNEKAGDCIMPFSALGSLSKLLDGSAIPDSPSKEKEGPSIHWSSPDVLYYTLLMHIINASRAIEGIVTQERLISLQTQKINTEPIDAIVPLLNFLPPLCFGCKDSALIKKTRSTIRRTNKGLLSIRGFQMYGETFCKHVRVSYSSKLSGLTPLESVAYDSLIDVYTSYLTKLPILAGSVECVTMSCIRQQNFYQPPSRIILQILENARKSQATALNKALGYHTYDVNIPLIMGAVLKEAKSPEDILRISNQMRRMKTAIEFRE